MEITKKPKIKSIPYDEFIDNESLEKLVKELNAGGANVALGVLDDFINWGRSNSLWPLTFATSCCGIEFMALGAARYDMARFGFEVARASPRQADMIMVCGTITNKMAPVLKRLGGFAWSYTPVQSIVSEREITPSSSAAIAVIGLKVDPGALIAWVALL